MAVDDDLFVEAEDHFAVARAAATPEAGLRAAPRFTSADGSGTASFCSST